MKKKHIIKAFIIILYLLAVSFFVKSHLQTKKIDKIDEQIDWKTDQIELMIYNTYPQFKDSEHFATIITTQLFDLYERDNKSKELKEYIEKFKETNRLAWKEHLGYAHVFYYGEPTSEEKWRYWNTLDISELVEERHKITKSKSSEELTNRTMKIIIERRNLRKEKDDLKKKSTRNNIIAILSTHLAIILTVLKKKNKPTKNSSP